MDGVQIGSLRRLGSGKRPQAADLARRLSCQVPSATTDPPPRVTMSLAELEATLEVLGSMFPDELVLPPELASLGGSDGGASSALPLAEASPGTLPAELRALLTIALDDVTDAERKAGGEGGRGGVGGRVRTELVLDLVFPLCRPAGAASSTTATTTSNGRSPAAAEAVKKEEKEEEGATLLIEPSLVLRPPTWLSHAQFRQLLDSLPSTCLSSTPVGSSGGGGGLEGFVERVLDLVDHLRHEGVPAILAQARQEAQQVAAAQLARLAESTPEAETWAAEEGGSSNVDRVWYWLPSLSTRAKRADIVRAAPTWSLTGFVLAGKPGIICLEGTAKNVDGYMNWIKAVSWSDIPSFQSTLRPLPFCIIPHPLLLRL